MLALALALALQDEVAEARIGLVDPHRPPGTVSTVFVSPAFDRCVVAYRLGDRLSFVLENGSEEPRAVKFLGWKMPEGKSVLLVRGTGGDDRRRILVGGADAGLEGVRDALLLREGTELLLAREGEGGVWLERDGERKGPFDQAEFVGRIEELPCVVTRTASGSRLHLGEKSFPLEGTPSQVVAAPGGTRVGWVEVHPDRRQRAVVDGRAGIPCDQVNTGIHFSPRGTHVAYVTREGGRYRGWIDGEEIKSERSVVAARALEDGTPVWVETWKEPLKTPPADPSAPRFALPGRIVVAGRPEERVLPQAIYNFEAGPGWLAGAGRAEAQSTIAIVRPSGVLYREVKGRVGPLFAAPVEEGGLLFVTGARSESFVHVEGRRSGPYDAVSDFFYLKRSGRFGYVAQKGARLQLVVGDRSFPLPLTEVSAPVRVSRTELTAVVVGVLARGGRREVWVRPIPLE